MKKYLQFPLSVLACILMAMNFSACSNDDPGQGTNPDSSEKDKMLEAACVQFVNNPVIATYKQLADDTETLVDKLKTLKTERTDANVKAACDLFKQARKQWELSEAFLFGAAGDFGIDPHIDSWPLDLNGLLDELKNEAHIKAMEAEDADVWAYSKLGQELLGFHSIEYILFKDGSQRAVKDIQEKELTYAIAVAGDLRNNCYRLQASWAGEEGTAANRWAKVVDKMEWSVTVNSGEFSYGENMKNAGKAGSTYSTWTAAAQAIIDGCKSIADEVGTQKIGKPHTGEDVNYIESPYSYNSIEDFCDNIQSIENAYMGGIEGDRGSSIHDYMVKINPDLDKQITDAIANTIARIKAMKFPFVKNYTDPSCQNAMDACKALDDILTTAKAELAKED